jgi:radical SAM protein with 4Fe4S-binding SPASM domain
MRLELITNGLGVAVQADALREAGFFGITFSVDGPEAIHDELRGIPGGLEQLLRGADALRERRVRIGAVTQLNRRSFPHLDQTAELLAAHGFEGWQWQLTMPQGRARERADALCLAPEHLPELERRFLELRSRVPFFVHLADNIGYMSRCEPKLRTQGDGPTRIWTGCSAGVSVVGITSDGTVRGCLSLPREADEGSLRDRSLSEIWNDPGAFAYNRRFKPEQLSGPCAGCPFGAICRGGCRSLAWSRGSPHSNAYCSGRVGREREREAHQS